jgi:hypothetical protein
VLRKHKNLRLVEAVAGVEKSATATWQLVAS